MITWRTYDEPDFLPFHPAEELGAIVFFHQGGDTVVNHRIRRYKLGNAVGNLTERALVFATSSSAAFSTGVLTSSPTWPTAVASPLSAVPGWTRWPERWSRIREGFIPPFGQTTGSPWPCPQRLSRAVHLRLTYSGPALRF